MSQLRLAGFTAVRVTSNWQPGLVAPTSGELRRPAEHRGRGAPLRRQGLRLRVPAGLPDDAARRGRPGRVRAVHRGARCRPAQLRRRHRRQRAEPEPLLAPAVRPGRIERVRPGVPLAARTHVRRPQGRRPAAARLGRRARAPRLRPARGHPADSSPTAFLQAMGAAYRASGRTLPVMDGLALHPYPDNSSQSPDFAHPRSTTIGLADYGKLVSLLGQAFDGTAQPGSALPDPLRRVRDRVDRPRRQAQPLHRNRADDHEARRRVPAGRRLRPRAAARVLPAERRRGAPLPLRTTSRRCSAGSRASTTPTARRKRASGRCATRSTGHEAGRSPAATGSRWTCRLTNVRFPGPREFQSGMRDTRFRCTLDCAWELKATRTTTGAVAAHRARVRPLRPDAPRVALRPQARLGPGASLADGDAGGESRRDCHPGERRAATGLTQGAPTE